MVKTSFKTKLYYNILNYFVEFFIHWTVDRTVDVFDYR